jgi:hypothetical protein
MSDTPRSWFFFKGRKPGPPAPPRAAKKVALPPAPPPPRVIESLEDRIRRLTPKIQREREAAAKAAAERARQQEAAAFEKWDEDQERLAERLARGDAHWPGDPTPPEYARLRRSWWFPARWW